MSDAISRATELLKARLREIESERVQLERALKQLQNPGTGAVRRRRTTTSAGSNRSRGRVTRRSAGRRIAPRGQRRAQLLRFLAERPGARPKEIAEGLGITTANAHKVLGQAKQARAVVKRDGGYALPTKRASAKRTTPRGSTAS